jgi:type II secretion system protein D
MRHTLFAKTVASYAKYAPRVAMAGILLGASTASAWQSSFTPTPKNLPGNSRLAEDARQRVAQQQTAEPPRTTARLELLPAASQPSALQQRDRTQSESQLTPEVFRRLFVREYHVPPARLFEIKDNLEAAYGRAATVMIAADPRDSRILVMSDELGHEAIGRQMAGFGLRSAAPFSQSFIQQDMAADYPLRNLNWRDLESSMVRFWGSAVTIQASRDGRASQVIWPVSRTQNSQFVIDRVNNSVRFTGAIEDIGAWQHTMRSLDDQVTAPGQTVQAVATSPKSEAVVKQAVSMYQLVSLKEAEANSKKKPLWGGQIAAAIFRPAQETPQDAQPAQENANQANEAGNGLQQALANEARIQIMPDGTLIVIARDDDREVIMRFIQELVIATKQNQPVVEIYPMQNVDGSSIQPIVQQIYDQSYAPTLGPATTTNLGKPNAIMIVGSPESVKALKELLEKLDLPTDAADTFRVYRIKHMSAIDAAVRLSNLFGIVLPTTQQNAAAPQQVQTDSVNAAAKLKIVPDFRSNSIIVQGSPREFAEIEKYLEAIDIDELGEEGAVNEIKVFPLKNSIAAELAPILQDALNGQLGPNKGQGILPTGTQQAQTQQNQQNQINPLGAQIRSAMISLKMIDPEKGTVSSTITFDIRVSADANSNSLIVTGPSKSMNLIQLLIAQLDRLPNAESVVKVFTIVNGDATLLAETLQNLFTSQTQTGGNQSTLGRLPLATGNGEVSLVGLQFAVDVRTNSIITAGSQSDMNVIEDLLIRLDEDQLTNRVHRVFRLQHVNADTVATAISSWISARDSADSNDPTFSTPYQTGQRVVSVVAETESNSLIVSASPEYYELVERLIKDIDRRRRVMVQAVLAQVALTGTDEFGIELGVQDSILFDRGLSPSNPIIGYPFNQVGIGNNLGPAGLASRENLAGQGLSNLNIGRNNGDVGYGGLVLSAGNESISILLRALKDRGKSRILSRPQIMTLENLRGFTQVGQNIPTPSLSQNNATGVQTSYEYLNTGIQLGVLPRVNSDGTIYMEVDVTNSSLDPGGGIPVQANSNGTTVNAPIINITSAQTTVTARSGQTIVIGGLITDSVTESRRGIPILSDVPYIGPLFRFDSVVTARTELLIILRPIIVDDDETLALVNQMEMDRMHWCYADVVNVHGPVDSSLLLEDMGTEVIYPDLSPDGTPVNGPDSFMPGAPPLRNPGLFPPDSTPVYTSEEEQKEKPPANHRLGELSTRKRNPNPDASIVTE